MIRSLNFKISDGRGSILKIGLAPIFLEDEIVCTVMGEFYLSGSIRSSKPAEKVELLDNLEEMVSSFDEAFKRAIPIDRHVCLLNASSNDVASEIWIFIEKCKNKNCSISELVEWLSASITLIDLAENCQKICGKILKIMK